MSSSTPQLKKLYNFHAAKFERKHLIREKSKMVLCSLHMTKTSFTSWQATRNTVCHTQTSQNSRKNKFKETKQKSLRSNKMGSYKHQNLRPKSPSNQQNAGVQNHSWNTFQTQVRSCLLSCAPLWKR